MAEGIVAAGAVVVAVVGWVEAAAAEGFAEAAGTWSAAGTWRPNSSVVVGGAVAVSVALAAAGGCSVLAVEAAVDV